MTTRKYMLSLLVLLLTSWQGHAQTVNEESRILMRNGTEYKGDIVRQIPDSIVVLEMVGGSLLVLTQREIAEITPVPHRFKKIRYYPNHNRSPLVVRNRGFSNQTSLQIYPRPAEWGGTALQVGLHYSLNYRFSHLLGAGIGTGIESYEGGAGMPVYLNLTGDAFPSHITPSYFVRAGYMFGVAAGWRNLDFDGGLMTEAGIGIKYRTRSRLEWMAGVGYRRQPVVETVNNGWWIDPGNPTEPQIVERVYSGIFLHYTVFF